MKYMNINRSIETLTAKSIERYRARSKTRRISASIFLRSIVDFFFERLDTIDLVLSYVSLSRIRSKDDACNDLVKGVEQLTNRS
jgi:hypothetical protein